MPKFSLHKLGQNLGLKVVSVGIAIALWAFVNAGQREQQISLQVPVSYRNLPAGMMIYGPSPNFVELLVSGPSTLLSLLDPGRLTLRLDLRGVESGQAEFKIGPQMFNVPRQVRIDRIDPAMIALDVDKIDTREVPVHVVTSGSVANGYRVSAVEATPATVRVTGPHRAVSQLQGIDTEPFELKNAAADAEQTLALIAPGSKVAIDADEVQARAKLQEVMGDREYPSVAVAVRDADYKARVQPRQVSITLHGPVRELSSLKLEGQVYVDAHGAAPGTHEVPVQIDLPGGVELVRQSPEKVKLRMSSQKVGTSS